VIHPESELMRSGHHPLFPPHSLLRRVHVRVDGPAVRSRQGAGLVRPGLWFCFQHGKGAWGFSGSGISLSRLEKPQGNKA